MAIIVNINTINITSMFIVIIIISIIIGTP
jgi:hypothetical protein